MISFRRAVVNLHGIRNEDPIDLPATNVTVDSLGAFGTVLGGEYDGLEFWVPAHRLRFVVAQIGAPESRPSST